MFRKFLLITIFVFLLLFLLPQLSSAAGLVPCGRSEDDPSTLGINEAQECTICHFFFLAQLIITDMAVLAFSMAAIVIVIGGIIILTSGGSPEKVSQGKKTITYAVIGVMVILFGWLIVNEVMLVLVGTGMGQGVQKLPWPWNKITCGEPQGNGNGGGGGGGGGGGDGGGASENMWKCIIKNVPGRICPPEGALDYYDPKCLATKEVCKSYCEGRANEILGAEFKECKKYSSPTICQNVEACQGGTGKRWMCIIDVGNAGLAKTGCTSVDQKYLYYSCSTTEEVCKGICDARVKEIDPTGNYGVKFKECRRYSSETECQGYIGCR